MLDIHVVEAPRSSERGASAVEYSLLVALIAAVIIGVVALIGLDLPSGFQVVEGAL